MEDPVRFDAWAQLTKPLPADAAAWLQGSRKDLSELDARKLLVRGSVAGSNRVLIGRGLGWADVQELRAEAPAWIVKLLVVQEGYGPGETRNYCSVHDLHYAGILGCHVCSDFYAP